jgi:hypothetical protein
MKNLNFLSPIIILSLLLGCQPPVTFDQPQPAETDALNSFPKHIRGNYQSLRDNSRINISSNSIIRTYDFNQRSAINELDSNYKIEGDTLIEIASGEKTKIKFDADTIIIPVHLSDTVFLLSEENVLKKFKGYYFLSFLYQKQGWEVKKLELNNGKLSLSHISTKGEIDTLKQLTESAYDSLPYRFKPTRKQFKKFVKAEGFSNSETFVRL